MMTLLVGSSVQHWRKFNFNGAMIINSLKFRSHLFIGTIIGVMSVVLFLLSNEYRSFTAQINKWHEMKQLYVQMHKIKQLCEGQQSVIKEHLVSNDQALIEQSRIEPVLTGQSQLEARKKPVVVTDTKKTVEVVSQVVSKNKKDIYFIWPVAKEKFWLSSYFGPRKLPNGREQFHNGIDMAALKGTPVRAAAGGIVDCAYEDHAGYGKTIIVKHNKKYKTRYAHLSKILVTKGQKIKQGQLIGHVGSTGNVRKKGRDASHLHFEVYAHEKRIDPLAFFR